MTKQRITLISLVGLLVFSLLLGGQILYKKNWVDASILHQSQQIPGVISAKVVEENGQQLLEVITNHVEDLKNTSIELEKLASGKPVRFRDQRNSSLEKLFDQMQFALQEGIIRGNFTQMAENVKKQAKKAGVEIDLSMDSNNIYIVLNKDKAQLVEVLERHSQGEFLPSEKL